MLDTQKQLIIIITPPCDGRVQYTSIIYIFSDKKKTQ